MDWSNIAVFVVLARQSLEGFEDHSVGSVDHLLDDVGIDGCAAFTFRYKYGAALLSISVSQRHSQLGIALMVAKHMQPVLARPWV